jgi:hypothetical protein
MLEVVDYNYLVAGGPFIEVLWVIFNYLGLEHYSITAGRIHLDYLPYSHSVFSTILISLLSYVFIRRRFKNNRLAFLFAIGVISYLVLDVIFHEKDIRLSPFFDTPVWGIGIIRFPILNFFLEFIYGIFCWWYHKGNKSLLIVIIIFNVLDLPIMLASSDALTILKNHSFVLPTFILFQILITWYFIWRYSKPQKNVLKVQGEKQKIKQLQTSIAQSH